MINWSDLGAVFLLGLTGAGHCLSMCGAFSVAVSAGAGSTSLVLWRQVAYQFGKATSYVFVGLVLLLAVGWADARWPLLKLQSAVSVLVGVFMICLGLAYALEVRLPAKASRWWQGTAACGLMATLWRSPSLAKSVLMGWVNGFLPCGLSLAALLALVSQGSLAGVVVGSYVFGLATMPALLAIGLVGHRISLLQRRWLLRVGGSVLVLFGAWTVARGVPTWNAWVHQHVMGGHAGGKDMHEGHGHHHAE